ncbi:CIC11C00000005825 [Sungouiella intermedia]|uniref:CIC11C00000005825 n=1 Tax=Sungouiella intermedia TaxID=45354 RepID=A0A1L0BQA5_9ASCO|nr:CIC11C00000005825 [[Candida] intermedia]
MSSDSVHSSKEMTSLEDHHIPVGKVQHSGAGDEFVTLGNKRYYKHELMAAFGGTLNPGLSVYPTHLFANPSPLGLCGFALTTFVLSMYNAQAMGIHTNAVVIGLACFYGGFAQFAAGIWEGLVGNTFALCALTSYGSFWLAFAAINLKAFGIAESYEGTEQMSDAVAFFLLGWAIFTFMLTLCTLKSTVAFCSLFSMLTLTFILLCAADFTGKVGLSRAGGVTGVITAFIAFYNAFAGTATLTNSYITARAIALPS